MPTILKAFLPTLMLMLLFNGCQTITKETLGENDDTTITMAVLTKLAACERYPCRRQSQLRRVRVNTNDGVVTLSGVLDSAGDRTHAEGLARRVIGVKDVVNNLQVP
jgi:osmotically-inducible protein OsmY